MSKLSNLRNGVREHSTTIIPGTDIKVKLVALTNKEIIESNEEATKYIENNNISKSNEELILNMYILSKCMRDIDNIDEQVGTFEDIYENLDPYIVFELNAKYFEVQSRAVVSLENLSTQEFNDIKKKLEMTQLKDLDGELQKNLKYFHLMMHLKSLKKNN